MPVTGRRPWESAHLHQFYFDAGTEKIFPQNAYTLLRHIRPVCFESLEWNMLDALTLQPVDANLAFLLTHEDQITRKSREMESRWKDLASREAPQTQDYELSDEHGWDLELNEPIDIEIV
jgi:hypothetical protein